MNSHRLGENPISVGLVQAWEILFVCLRGYLRQQSLHVYASASVVHRAYGQYQFASAAYLISSGGPV